MDPSYTEQYEQFELHHWWHIVRRRIIHDAIRRHVPNHRMARWLDVGCGTGVLLNSVPEIPDRMGLELDSGLVERGRAKGLDIRQTAPDWNFRPYGQFDLITLCDVLEHVEQESDAIDAVDAVLKPGGILLVTVPALMSLWSGHDVVNRHYRRYTRATLLRNFDPGRWRMLKASYFSSLLLPLIWAARKIKNWREGLEEKTATHDMGQEPMPWLFRAIFGLEVPWLRVGSFPLGSSLIAVARKKTTEATEKIIDHG